MPVVLDARGLDLRTASRELKAHLNEQPVVVRNVGHLHGFAAGLKAGQVAIEGDSGDYLGVLNNGAAIRVTGDAGQYVADNMTRGDVVIEGNAAYGAAQYCCGGTVIIKGSAGDFVATMNKGATVIITGNVGDEAATYMLAGDLIIVGDAGHNLGNYLIRGSIYIGGRWASLGHNCRVEPLTSEDMDKLRSYFGTYGIVADPAAFKKVVPLSAKPFYK